MFAKRLAMSLALIGAATSAGAATITNSDGTFDFGGFDWSSAGSVFIQSYGVTSGMAIGTTDTFTLSYQAFAANVQDSSGANLVLGGLRAGSGTGYEYTINAVLTEQVTCINAGCTAVQIDVIGGTWDIRYQTVGDALAGSLGMAGILNGNLLLSGVFTGGDSIFGPQGASNPGNVTLAGTFTGNVLTTDITCSGAVDQDSCINPELSGTEAVSTLQFGNNTTAWTRPSTFDGFGALPANTNTNFVGQADANQAFTVPEPASLCLIGLGLGLAGLAQRRRQRRAI